MPVRPTCVDHGLAQGFEYKMRFVYAHFPINVAITGKKNKVEIRNFLGEKVVRIVDAYPGVEVTRSADVKDEIVLVGNDIDNVSKTWCACRSLAWPRNGAHRGGLSTLDQPVPRTPLVPRLRTLPNARRLLCSPRAQCSDSADLRCEAQGHSEVPRRHLRVCQGQRGEGLSLLPVEHADVWRPF